MAIVKIYWFFFDPVLLLLQLRNQYESLMDSTAYAEKDFLVASNRAGKTYLMPAASILLKLRYLEENPSVQKGIEILENGVFVATRRNILCVVWALIAFRSYKAEVDKEVRRLLASM